MSRKPENSEYTEYIRAIQQLNAQLRVKLSEIEAVKEDVGEGSMAEMRLRMEAIDICYQLAEKSEGTEKEHWLQRIQELEQELPAIDFSEADENAVQTKGGRPGWRKPEAEDLAPRYHSDLEPDGAD